jgi:hypothetical protein
MPMSVRHVPAEYICLAALFGLENSAFAYTVRQANLSVGNLQGIGRNRHGICLVDHILGYVEISTTTRTISFYFRFVRPVAHIWLWPAAVAFRELPRTSPTFRVLPDPGFRWDLDTRTRDSRANHPGRQQPSWTRSELRCRLAHAANRGVRHSAHILKRAPIRKVRPK